MDAAIDGAPSFLFVLLITIGVLLFGSLIATGHVVRSYRGRLQALREAYEETSMAFANAQQALTAQRSVLLDMEREVARLKRVPKAELLPMMQLAHELRSPLAAVQSSLEIVLQGYTRNDPALHDEMLSIAQHRAMGMLERVNDFLRLGAVRYAEIERRPHPVHMLDVMRELAPEMSVRVRWAAVNLDLQLPESLPPVSATDEEIEHLLSNLINNAIKYTDPGGRVTVSMWEENGDVVGTVKDTGIGIPAEEIPRIFGEFYRTGAAKARTQGTGLGLSIVKRVLDLYGGQIRVASEPGKGSTFTFSLPAIKEKETAQ
ncbi:MAG TPA: HAMP domain-containing sensor histidine kinase [Anaerolineae bacterium]|nr:HAMP domain-containing sensor histidine kinase [Anaerolineae bacterium]